MDQGVAMDLVHVAALEDREHRDHEAPAEMEHLVDLRRHEEED